MKNIWVAIVLSLISVSSGAADLIFSPGLRTYPFSASAELRARHEFLLWDKRNEAFWKYGFVQPQLAVAAHGLAEADLSFFPVSILELTAGISNTSRFYNTKPFDCDSVVCKGNLRRERLTARLLGGFGDWIAVATYHRIWLSTEDRSKPFADEVEVLEARPGNDSLEAGSLLFGRKLGSEMIGLYMKKARLLEAAVGNENQYLVYKRPFENYSCLLGVGRYASDFTPPGLSVYATLVWTWGKSLAMY